MTGRPSRALAMSRAASSISIASTPPNRPSMSRLWPVPQPTSRMRAPRGGLIRRSIRVANMSRRATYHQCTWSIRAIWS